MWSSPGSPLPENTLRSSTHKSLTSVVPIVTDSLTCDSHKETVEDGFGDDSPLYVETEKQFMGSHQNAE